MEGLEETRTRLCEQFVTVTGTDSAVAQCYLAENDWDMEVKPPFRMNLKGIPHSYISVLNSGRSID